eukprot:CAMPEP_0170579082 /NCGR_PEP_ID=MMETSP0224-20130122/5799_1 /TAXON_ID=285029 /ORGANISM="Togula jolla, Strain CCCM 725" /LENGTH=74 /DNA_ID=CAMNT_0010902093 /DNA_START=263 /DNA_END=484 /DNA_ORIENTATION=+
MHILQRSSLQRSTAQLEMQRSRMECSNRNSAAFCSAVHEVDLLAVRLTSHLLQEQYSQLRAQLSRSHMQDVRLG